MHEWSAVNGGEGGMRHLRHAWEVHDSANRQFDVITFFISFVYNSDCFANWSVCMHCVHCASCILCISYYRSALLTDEHFLNHPIDTDLLCTSMVLFCLLLQNSQYLYEYAETMVVCYWSSAQSIKIRRVFMLSVRVWRIWRQFFIAFICCCHSFQPLPQSFIWGLWCSDS